MSKRLVLVLSMLWLVGVASRVSILAIPPLLPFIQADLRMSGTEIGALSGIPMILMAIAAFPGSAMVGWVGALRTVLIGLLVAAIGSLLRGFAPITSLLFVTTAVMSAGVAVTQPAIPALVRQWLPAKVGFGMATYSSGMLVGCIVPVMLTLPLVMPVFHDSWQWALIVWSLPVFATVAFVAAAAPAPTARDNEAPARFLSGLDYGLIWRIGMIFGSNNCVYFGTNAFLPAYLVKTGHPQLVTLALTVYNIAQLVGTFSVMALAHRVERRHWPYISAGICLVLNLAWLATSSGYWTVVAATTLGCFSGTTLATGLMLPPLLSKPSEVARVAAGTYTVSYALAMICLLFGGMAWDFFAHPRFAFLVVGLCMLPLMVITPSLNFARS
jgi:CP family cyanate transporter-like MFS transporter